MDPITLTALTASIGSILTIITGYLLKSRCTKVNCCFGCVECVRKARTTDRNSTEISLNSVS